MGVMRDLEGQKKLTRNAFFMWADNYWVTSHSKANLQQMIKDLIQEAEGWDLEPKPASLWWTSTCES